MNILETRNVVKKYANHLALNDVSVEIKENSVFGLLGPNGAGKTTLIRIINHITGPDAGEVIFKGKTLRAEDVHNIGYLPEERGLYRKMKVGEQAMYLARLKGVSKQDAYRKLRQWFEKFEIGEWWNKKVEELSKGMQQKVQFITTVLHEPELLIFDEPFSGFDPINTELLKREILELRAKGSTVIFSTHNMASVEEVCDEMALINRSKVVLSGNVNDIKQQFKSNKVLLELATKETITPDFFGDQFLIESNEPSYYGQKLKIKTVDASMNDLLKVAVNKAEVKSLQEIIPSMHEIFIRVVEESKTENQVIAY